MNSIPSAARKAGALYLVFAVVAVVRQYAFPAFLVPGDAAATARNIAAAEPAYRAAVLTGFLTHVLFLCVVVSLYALLKEAGRKTAMLMVLFVATGVALSFANLVNELAPLVLLHGAGDYAALGKPQLDALALAFLRLHAAGATVAMVFWGLWLFPFGALVIRSGWFPRILGVLLLVAGLGYLATGVTALGLPEHRRLVARFMMPLYFGELPIVYWLLIKGAKPPASAG